MEPFTLGADVFAPQPPPWPGEISSIAKVQAEFLCNTTPQDVTLPSWIYQIDSEEEYIDQYDEYRQDILEVEEQDMADHENRIACLRLAPFPIVQTSVFDLETPWNPYIPEFAYSEDSFVSNISKYGSQCD